MILSRKGLSDIVTNVLIILLVLVAIGIIWAFVRPTINQGAGQLQGQNECLTAELEAVSCDMISSTNYTVTYRRSSGSGDIQAIKFIFKDANGNSKVITESTAGNIPEELESRTVLDVNPDGTYTSFDTAVVVRIASDPNGRTCDARATPVVCA